MGIKVELVASDDFLGTIKGDQGIQGIKGDKGDKGDTGGVDGLTSLGGYIGIQQPTPVRRLHVSDATALTNTQTFPLRLTHVTSGTPAANIGVGIEFEQQTDAGTPANKEIIAIIDAYMNSVAAGAEASVIRFRSMYNGAITGALLSLGQSSITLSVNTSVNGTLSVAGANSNAFANNQYFSIGNQVTNTGFLRLFAPTFTGTATAATSFTITCSIPAGAKLIGVNLRVDTALSSSDGGTSFSAAWSGGATQAIVSGKAFAKSTVASAFFNINAATDITSTTTNITITCDGAKTFIAGGVVRAIVYYQLLVDMGAAP